MYARALTDRAIAAASAAQGWALVRRTPDEIQTAIRYFDELRDPDSGELTRKLTEDETRFIENERVLCGLDFRHFAQYVHIVNDQKQDVVFTPRIAQNIVLDLWAESECRGVAIIQQNLKARQLGITTLSQIAVLHRFQFIKNTYAVLASADPFKTIEMAEMINYAWEHEPWWLKPADVRYRRNIPAEIPELHSVLRPQWGNQYHGVGRGQTPNVAHLSEISSWANAADDIDSALFKAMHPGPDVLIIMESTALGRDNWWFDEWELNKVDYPKGLALIRPTFLPWFVGTDIYPTPTDLRERPIPPNWVPLDRTLAHAERARRAVLSNPLWLKYIAKDDREWRLPRNQLWYYEIERERAIKKKQLNKFLSEMPADDQEAFQNTNISVIDQDVILRYREEALSREPLGVYTLVGPTIHQTLVVPRSQWDQDQDVIAIDTAGICRARLQYSLVPVKFDGYIGYDPMWKFFIWEWPEDGETYGIGVDLSEGIGEDWAVIEVIRKGNLHRPHAQVAEFASPYIKANQLWEPILALASLYSVYQPQYQQRRQCRVCIECMFNGEKSQDELKKLGWSNFHPWKRLDNRRRTPLSQVHKEGIMTNRWFRAALMDTLLTAIDEEAIDLRSPWLIKELETLERDPDESSARAAYTCHDDRVMALGFPLESLTVDDKGNQRFRKAVPQYLPDYLDADAAQQRSPYATWTPPDAARDLDARPVTGLRRDRPRGGRAGQLLVQPYVNPRIPLGNSPLNRRRVWR